MIPFATRPLLERIKAQNRFHAGRARHQLLRKKVTTLEEQVRKGALRPSVEKSPVN